MIHIVTEDFDNFMQEAVGKSDGELAFERGDRADHWSPEQLGQAKFNFTIPTLQSHQVEVNLAPVIERSISDKAILRHQNGD